MGKRQSESRFPPSLELAPWGALSKSFPSLASVSHLYREGAGQGLAKAVAPHTGCALGSWGAF